MLPLLLAQVEALDVDALLKTVLAAGGGSLLAGFIVRQWALNRLREFELLVKRSKRDAIRWRLLARYMKSQAVESNRQRRNGHQIRNVQTSVLFALDQLGEACHVKIKLPSAEDLEWEPGQLEPLDLQLTDDAEASSDGGDT